ncbi:23294_t:CDS:2 [Entrophospora sp. SA101]|nr:12109_t:CDS:2 [Entrophospora sp. SA101]CAJ0767943.1 23294_t:CDS:2 [Entrophospora sp. SA101]
MKENNKINPLLNVVSGLVGSINRNYQQLQTPIEWKVKEKKEKLEKEELEEKKKLEGKRRMVQFPK